VVGGGITGTAAAWYLAHAGAEVILADRWDLNTQASGRNAGSLHGQIQHAPFLERGEDWAVGFQEALRFLRESLDIWNGLSTDLHVDLEVNLGGGLLVAETQKQLNDIRRKVRIEESAGIYSDILDAADLQVVAPYLSSAMAGAQLCHVEGKANPLLAGPAFAKAATVLGARVLPQTNVDNITAKGSRFIARTTAGPIDAGRIVVAAGNYTNSIAELWGKPLPISDEPVQVSVTETLAPFVKHLVYFAGDKLTFKQAKAGTLLIGGGWDARLDPETGIPTVDAEALQNNLAVALKVAPKLAGVRIIRTWAGMGLVTPDLSPIIDTPGPKGVVVGVFPHMGLTAGPLMGRILAELALDLNPSFSIDRFRLDRF
jgi:sarcosine oxidase subunit beta